MPLKFVCDFKFHDVLQTTIIRWITNENEENEKIEKYSKKTVRIVYKSLCVLVSVCVCVCVCVCVRVITTYYCVWMYNWCLVYVCV